MKNEKNIFKKKLSHHNVSFHQEFFPKLPKGAFRWTINEIQSHSKNFVESRNTLVVFISKKYKICFFGGHKAQEFGGGEGVRTVFSYMP